MVITSTSVTAGSIVAVVVEGSMVITSTSVTAGSIVAVVVEGSMVITSTSVTAGSIVAVEMTVSILPGSGACLPVKDMGFVLTERLTTALTGSVMFALPSPNTRDWSWVCPVHCVESLPFLRFSGGQLVRLWSSAELGN